LGNDTLQWKYFNPECKRESRIAQPCVHFLSRHGLA
jgi:hypothetical protein